MLIYPLVRGAFPSLILLLLISCGSLFFRLGSLPLSGADEPRYARIAQEMRDQGSWVTPLLEGKPWLEKPPLYYWITAPFYSTVGISETAARLGPAICALITALSVFWLGSALWSIQAGFIGAAVLLTSIGFAGFGRSAATDMPFTCFLTLSLATFASWSRRRSPAGSGWPVLLAYLFLGLAVLAKGPVAIVLVAGILLCVWFLDDRGLVLSSWHLIPGMIVTAVVSIPWFWLVFRQNGFGFISTFFINHNLARYVTGIHHHSQPFFYYLPVLIALLFPWSSWLPVLLGRSTLAGLRQWREWNPSMVFLGCWFSVPMVFFSLSDSKLAGYILPSLPPLALILGMVASRSVDKSRLRAVAFLTLLLSAAMAVAAPLVFQEDYGGNWRTGLLVSAAALIPALFTFVLALKGKCIQALGATVVQGLAIVVILAQFAFPVLGAYQSTREIAQKALQMRQAGEPIVTYRFFHHSLHYYTGYKVAGKLDTPQSLVQFARNNPASLVVTNTDGTKDISSIKELVVSDLADQGDFHLLRIIIRDSRFEIRD